MATTIQAPSGIVTFVFTDIEGSTRLFHRFGEGYPPLLEQHNEILSGVWAGHNGYEVSTEGDSFFVAFADADDAIRACAEGQRLLAAADWPQNGRVKVRMGAHTGLASPVGDDYVALAVHQAARVVAAAHGGQVLVSQSTVDESGVFNDLELRPIGDYQLRSFDEPLTLYQLRGPGLEEDFPAVRALPAGHHNIVRRPTATIGRDSFIDAVRQQVQPGKLVTLVGPGGIGKSTVAAEVGILLAPSWRDGVWLVDLAGVEDEDLVAPAIAGAVGAAASSTRERWDDVVDHLEDKGAVVILDNCEQFANMCGRLAASLEARCPEVAVIATSRVPLGVPGELLWHVAPLEVPETDHSGPADVLASPAGKLFAARAAAARPGFEVDEANAPEVAEIVRRLDGLPLALELAAARLAMQSPAEILQGLDEGLGWLRSRDAGSPRHSSLQDVLEWSYESLDAREQAAFRRLAIFAGGFSLATAGPAVSGADIEAAAASTLLFSLVDRSLVLADLSANATRYRLLETYRTYGRRLLEEHQETEAVAARVAEALLRRAGPWDVPDAEWQAEVATEADNLRGLIPTLAADREETAQQIACTIGRYHDASQSFREGIDELSRYEKSLPTPSPSRVSLLTTLADLYLRTGDARAAQNLVEEAAALRDGVGAPDWDDVGVDRTRGEVARRSGDLAGAVEIARRALERARTDRGRSRMYNLLGTTAAARGDMQAAYEACRSDLELSKNLGHESSIASAHGNLAEIAMRLGDVAEAARHQAASLEFGVAHGSIAMVAFSLIMAARIAGHLQRWEDAVLLHAKAEQLLDRLGLQLYEDDRRESDVLVGETRRRLGDATFDALEAEGRALEVPDGAERASRLLDAAANGATA